MSCLLFNIVIESLAQMLRSSNLKGIELEEIAERLITTLFADDTTVYLSEEDSFQDLQEILKEWCSASDASFNIPKTVIVPVETEEHRNDILTTWRTKNASQAISSEIKIARDGEATRLLGAFIGNKVDNVSVWMPTIEAISKDLKK